MRYTFPLQSSGTVESAKLFQRILYSLGVFREQCKRVIIVAGEYSKYLIVFREHDDFMILEWFHTYEVVSKYARSILRIYGDWRIR